MNVGEIMTRNVRSCGGTDSVNRAAQLMWENDCGSLPVLDGEGRAIAMITDRDICMAAYTQGQTLANMPVSIAASREIVTVGEGESLDVAEALMQEHRVRRLPVVDTSGKLVGILCMNDLARRAHSGGFRHDSLRAENVLKTLAAVSQPAQQRNGAQSHATDHAHAAE